MQLLTVLSVTCLFGLGVSRLPILIDENGCGPIPRCAAPPLGCRTRSVTDSNGCITGCTYDCTCGPKAFCAKKCDHGYLLDEQGCQMCMCKCGPLPLCVAPEPGCRVSFTRDANGCITGCDYDCTCGPKLLQQLCPKVCEQGYELDANGCETCNCKCGPLPPCAPPPPGCSAILVRNKDGCVTGCDYDCPCGLPRLCPNICPNGYVQDSKGCNTCQCKCPRSKVCKRKCPSGYAKNASGCPTCLCDPIIGLECHKWMKCSQGVCPHACACKPNCDIIDIAK